MLACRAAKQQTRTAAAGNCVATRPAEHGRTAAARKRHKDVASVAEYNVVGFVAAGGHGLAAAGRKDRVCPAGNNECVAGAHLDHIVPAAGADRVITGPQCTDRVIAVAGGDQPAAGVCSGMLMRLLPPPAATVPEPPVAKNARLLWAPDSMPSFGSPEPKMLPVFAVLTTSV